MPFYFANLPEMSIIQRHSSTRTVPCPQSLDFQIPKGPNGKNESLSNPNNVLNLKRYYQIGIKMQQIL